MRRLLKKILAVSLCAALVGGTAAALPVVMPDSGITASAADALSYGDFEYNVSGNEVTITNYSGSSGAVTIPSKIDGKSVTIIGDWAFYGCESLTSITIPNSVTSIGNSAFSGCSSLTSITIPDSVTSIGYCAFEDCSSLTNITIPDSVTSIGGLAFFDCSSLTSITIPSSVTSIGADAFAGTGWYNAKPDGIVYAGKVAYKYKGEVPSEMKIVLKDGTRGIAEGAFQNCSGLKSIMIPSSVTSIGDYAFIDCSSLTSVTIPSSVTSIGNEAFEGCIGLTSITIPDSVTSIGNEAFEGCSNLTSITIPDSVEYISRDAFAGTAWYNAKPDGIVYVGKVAYKYKGEVPSEMKIVLKDGTRGIAEGAFQNCSGLKSIMIPSSVTSIGDCSFYGCKSLTSITIPNSVTSIGDWAFKYCSSLTSITIPNSVTSIGGGAFSDCSSLTSITIPDSVTIIGWGAFPGCSSLTSITIPDSVTSIENCAFSDCSSLTSITIPSSVTSIGDSAFSGCSSLMSITIPSSVTSIGEDAFCGCTGLTSITIPNSVTSIGSGAFVECSSLTSITIPNSVTSIGEDAFGYYYDDDYETKKVDDFTIYGKTGSAAEKYAKDNGFKFVAQSEVQPTSITLSKTSLSLEKGKSIKLTATVSPSNATDKTVKWSTDKSYVASVDSTGLIKANSCGTATITAKTSNGKAVTCKITVTDSLKNSSTISATSVNAGTAVTLNGKAAGGKAPYKFAYYYKKSTESTWTKAYVTASGSAYTKNTSVAFKPTTAGTYNVKVNAKDDEGTVVAKEFKVTVTEALKNSSTISATSVTANTAVTLTGKATGGTAPYKYAYYYKKSTDSSWTKVAGYSTATTKTFKPTSVGTYTARVNVKDSTGKLVQKDFTVTIKADTALKNNSIVSAETASLDTGVTITAKATGGTAPYKYAYYYKKTTDSNWTVLDKVGSSAYSTNTTAKFKPSDAGTYNVRVNVKDNNGTGTVVSKVFTVTVKAAVLANDSTVSATSAALDAGVTITAKATGGTAPYKYAYYYKKASASSWTVLDKVGSSAYSTNTTANFKPSNAGIYNLRVNIKDSKGTLAQKDFTVTVK